MRTSGIGLSIVLMAAGAILAWAVNVDSENIDLNTVGVILMIAGGVGLIATIAFTAAGTRTIVERDREIVVDTDRTRRPDL